MRFDYKKLRSRIIEIFGTYEKFAEHIGKDKGYISRYMNNHSSFTQELILSWCESLQIDNADIPSYFFVLEFTN